MEADEELPPEEREIVQLVRHVRDNGDTRPLVALLKGEDGGPERARTALHLLGELDPELLVQVALDALIDANFDDPSTAEQTRRIVRT